MVLLPDSASQKWLEQTKVAKNGLITWCMHESCIIHELSRGALCSVGAKEALLCSLLYRLGVFLLFAVVSIVPLLSLHRASCLHKAEVFGRHVAT